MGSSRAREPFRPTIVTEQRLEEVVSDVNHAFGNAQDLIGGLAARLTIVERALATVLDDVYGKDWEPDPDAEDDPADTDDPAESDEPQEEDD